MTGSPVIRSIVCQRKFFVGLVLLFSACYVLQSLLHIIYAGNSDILSGIQTHKNVGMNNSTLQITTDKQRYLPGETVFVTTPNNRGDKIKLTVKILIAVAYPSANNTQPHWIS
jgi:hypothetical protein